MSDTNFYIDPAEFFQEMLVCLNAGKVSQKLGSMFMILSEKNANHRYFVRYVHIRDDLISEGVAICCEKFDKFRPLRSDDDGNVVEWDGTMLDYHYLTCNNPFAYFTRVIHNAFKGYLKRQEYRERNIINELRLQNDLPADAGYMDMMSDSSESIDDVNLDEVDDLDFGIEDALSSGEIGEDATTEEKGNGILW